MPRKKKELDHTFEPVEPTVKALEKAQYWEWRNACTTIWYANGKQKLAELEAKVLQLETEIIKGKLALHNAVKVKAAKEEALQASLDYNKIKEDIEGKLGVSLNNKIIDDVTFEIKDVPEEAKS